MSGQLQGRRIANLAADGVITSSRMPGDLPAFCTRIVEQFGASVPQRSDAN
jgi:hypothetical protein